MDNKNHLVVTGARKKQSNFETVKSDRVTRPRIYAHTHSYTHVHIRTHDCPWPIWANAPDKQPMDVELPFGGNEISHQLWRALGCVSSPSLALTLHTNIPPSRSESMCECVERRPKRGYCLLLLDGFFGCRFPCSWNIPYFQFSFSLKRAFRCDLSGDDAAHLFLTEPNCNSSWDRGNCPPSLSLSLFGLTGWWRALAGVFRYYFFLVTSQSYVVVACFWYALIFAAKVQFICNMARAAAATVFNYRSSVIWYTVGRRLRKGGFNNRLTIEGKEYACLGQCTEGKRLCLLLWCALRRPHLFQTVIIFVPNYQPRWGEFTWKTMLFVWEILLKWSRPSRLGWVGFVIRREMTMWERMQ